MCGHYSHWQKVRSLKISATSEDVGQSDLIHCTPCTQTLKKLLHMCDQDTSTHAALGYKPAPASVHSAGGSHKHKAKQQVKDMCHM